MISVIIPVYNEEIALRKVLAALPYGEDIEVIVVDGGSSDKTVEFAKQHPVKLIQYIKNRAAQMNEGAKIARGDIFLFLHADCLLEEGNLDEIARSLGDGCAGGCLSQKINSNRLIYRFIEASGNIRAKLFKIFYGDQAIFVRREIFFKLGGFDSIPLFEDILFSKKLRMEGKVKILKERIFVSSRRWEKNGVMKTTFINWLLTLGFMLGIPLHILKRIYVDVR